MKIQLYITQQISGPQSIIRKLDGVYTLLDPINIAFPNINVTAEMKCDYYTKSVGTPCNQKRMANRRKHGLLYDATTGKGYQAFNAVMYGIPETADIYPMEEP